MPYEVFWFDDSYTLLYQRYQPGFDLTDLYEVAETSATMLATVGHPVDIIVELAPKGMPNLNGVLRAAQYVDSIVSPNQRLVVVVRASSFMRSVVELSCKIAPKATEKLYFVDTLEEALALIQSYRAQLDQENRSDAGG
ncbi:MAG: hypothetical protein SNJ54_10225 [Anaerolineae bacterium]